MLSGNNAISTPLERRELLSCFQYPSLFAPHINATCHEQSPRQATLRVQHLHPHTCHGTATSCHWDLRCGAKAFLPFTAAFGVRTPKVMGSKEAARGSVWLHWDLCCARGYPGSSLSPYQLRLFQTNTTCAAGSGWESRREKTKGENGAGGCCC